MRFSSAALAWHLEWIATKSRNGSKSQNRSPVLRLVVENLSEVSVLTTYSSSIAKLETQGLMRRGGEIQPARSLICFPIIHTPADMGALKGIVQDVQISKLGRQGWQRSLASVDKYWTRIETVVAGLPLCHNKVRLYQDGLPECDGAAEIVTELAEAGSRNHRLLLQLMNKGAMLTGTESAKFLLEEYRLMTQVFSSRDPKRIERNEARTQAARQRLLTQRDQHIAARINETLGPGETGILFLGALHSLNGLLAKDIRITYPLS